jgi:hypothetical protein
MTTRRTIVVAWPWPAEGASGHPLGDALEECDVDVAALESAAAVGGSTRLVQLGDGSTLFIPPRRLSRGGGPGPCRGDRSSQGGALERTR